MSALIDQDRAARAAMVTAALMIGQQVAGKATRDAVFLSAFDISWLPPMILVAAAVSIAAGSAGAGGAAFVSSERARLTARRGPDGACHNDFGPMASGREGPSPLGASSAILALFHDGFGCSCGFPPEMRSLSALLLSAC